MDQKQSQHFARMRHLREAFAEANERLVARLRAATDEAAAHSASGGWTPAQIGWHVATVTNRFAGLISGDVRGVVALPDDFVERPWAAIAAAIPGRLEAPGALLPPPVVSRDDAISALEAAGMRMARAFDSITPERGARLGITSAIVGGTITVYQIGEWATAHIIRHNRQAKRALGQG
jgi:hypothetical protein